MVSQVLWVILFSKPYLSQDLLLLLFLFDFVIGLLEVRVLENPMSLHLGPYAALLLEIDAGRNRLVRVVFNPMSCLWRILDFESFHSVLTLYVDRMAFDPAATLLLWLEDPIDVVMMVRVNINPI